jgi:hypothetical protein
MLITGRSTPEATPRPFDAGAGGATTTKTCVCAAKLQLWPSRQLFEGALPPGIPFADEAGNISSVLLFICRVIFSSCDSAVLP